MDFNLISLNEGSSWIDFQVLILEEAMNEGVILDLHFDWFFGAFEDDISYEFFQSMS
jgi:hypothetical protein